MLERLPAKARSKHKADAKFLPSSNNIGNTETRSWMISDGVVLIGSMHHLLADDPAVKSWLLRPSNTGGHG